MGFWRSLFGGPYKPTVEETAAAAPDGPSLLNNIVDIPERKFVGLSARSPNGRYTLAWSDGGPDQTRKGRWLLLEGRKVIADGRMPRPNDGKVCDTGIFILNDWGSSSALSGTFKAFRPDGTVILTRKFSANLFNNGLSADGRFAVCQTCNAPSEDAGGLFVFDLASGAEAHSWAPESGWANTYEFSADGQTVALGYAQMGAFRYTLAGEFIDRSLWLSASLRKGDLYTVQRLLAEVDGKPSPELVRLLLPAIETGMKALHATQGKVKAFALKLRGQCYDALGDTAPALAAFTEALALDPKVGVKRRAEQLRKLQQP